jgi:hypothetical protein
LATGSYPIRILGESEDHQIVEAHTTVLMGPLLDIWNYIRRPSPRIEMTVCEPAAARVSAESASLNLKRGESATLELKTENIPESAVFQVLDLPAGVSYKLTSRQPDRVMLEFDASPTAAVGPAEISAETAVNGRRAASQLVTVSVVDR